MTRITPARRAARHLVLAALLGSTLAGCTKKVTVTDPRFTVPEGQPANGALLLTYSNMPVHRDIYLDKDGNSQFSIGDVLVGEDDTYFDDPSDLYGLIVDSTAATQYEVFRKEMNGTVHRLSDFEYAPRRRWLDTHWEAYKFSDPTRSGYQPPTYIGRGVVAGVTNPASPLTNFSSVAPVQPATIYFRFIPWSCQDCKPWLDHCSLRVFPRDSVYQPPDTLFAMRWTPVTGAAGYWIQVYDAEGDATLRVRSAQPSPLFFDASHDYLVAYVPAPADSYKVGAPGATVLTRGTLIAHHDYLIRISAVNADGELVGFMPGDTTTAFTEPRTECGTADPVTGVINPAPCLARINMGAVHVSALRPCPPGVPCPNPETPDHPPPCSQ